MPTSPLPRQRALPLFRASLFGGAILVLCTSALARKVEPPVELLHAPENMLVAGTLVEINPAGRLVFRFKELLSGHPRPPPLIDLRVAPDLLETVALNERYVFGYSMVAEDARQQGRAVRNPDGGVLLTSIGLEPALFRDSVQVRQLLKAGRTEHARESRRFVDRLLAALAGSDRALQILAAGEFVADDELRERLLDDDRKALQAAARDTRLPGSARSSLLRAAASDPEAFGDWAPSVAMEVLGTTPLEATAGPAPAADELVLASLELLDRARATVPTEALSRWAWSASAPIAERALLALRRQSAASERATLQRALADPNLPATTRTFLEVHRQRLDRLDARAAGQHKPSG